MNPDFRVDAESLRTDAAAVTGLAARVSAAAAHLPRADRTPRWATTAATTLTAGTAHRLISVLGHDIAETADRVRAVATDYDESDARAATRLRAPR